MMRLLVTGASGFVGSHAAEELVAAGAAVRALVRESSRAERLLALGAEVVRGRLEDPATLAAAVEGADAVVHMAAATHAPSAAGYRLANEVITARLVEAVLAAHPRPVRLVYLSSLAAIGPGGDRPVGPDDPPHPVTRYGRSKLRGEDCCRAASGSVGIVILRAPAVYGPRDREMLRFFRWARAGWIPIPGGRSRPIQMIHATDLARAIRLAAMGPAADGTFHVAHPERHDMAGVARLVARAVGRPARVVPIPPALVRLAGTVSGAAARAAGRSTLFNRDKTRELLAPGWLCETGSARRALGFEARIPLEEGLRETARWYREEGWLAP